MTGETKTPPPKKESLLVGCDCHVLMWAFPWGSRPKKNVSAHVTEMRKRARILMKQLDEQGANIVVPSVVLSEFLAGIEPEKHGRVLAEFSNRFVCPPFDVPACPLAAKLWQFERGLKGVHAGLPESDRTERPILKSDILVVASCKTAGAALFFSHDKKCRRLASQAGLDARDLPVSSGNFILDQEAAEESPE